MSEWYERQLQQNPFPAGTIEHEHWIEGAACWAMDHDEYAQNEALAKEEAEYIHTHGVTWPPLRPYQQPVAVAVDESDIPF